jgi:hypothetical protein
MKPRAEHRWRRQLEQLHRVRGLKEDSRFVAALDEAVRAATRANPEARVMAWEEVQRFAPPGSAGLTWYLDVPKATGSARNRQVRRRKGKG